MSDKDKYTVSYLYLRRIVGILGIALPIVLIIGSMLFGGCAWFQDSISDYHNTNMRNVFVGLLSAISLFLFAYSGYDKLDFWMAKAVGVLGFMVAVFPDGLDDNECTIFPNQIIPPWMEYVHLFSAAIFFLILAYFSIFLFTKSEKDNDETTKEKGVASLAVSSVKIFFKKRKVVEDIKPEKARRNKIYRRCGYTMLICLALILVIFAFDDFAKKIEIICPVLILETVALWAFGISWLIKGQFLIKDK